MISRTIADKIDHAHFCRQKAEAAYDLYDMPLCYFFLLRWQEMLCEAEEDYIGEQL